MNHPSNTFEEKTKKSVNTQAVFCVCASDDVINVAVNVSAAVSGFFFAGAFDDYITAERRPQFPQSMKTAGSCVAFVDFDKDPVLALKTVARLSQIFVNRICLVAVSSGLDSTLLLQAIRAGCMEYLAKPINPADLTASLVRFRQFMAVSPQSQSSTGLVLGFFGAKGGVGTTTLAVHLAMHLVAKHGRKTLLIDHKHQLGHVALYLGLKDTQYHFDELLRNVDRLDVELLNGYVMRHSSGLDVLASPDIATKYHDGKLDEIERVMDFLRREYDFILIDSSIKEDNTKTSIIDQADEVYLISTPDVASLRDLMRLVEHISLRPATERKLNLIINRSTANDSISPDEIRKAVKFPVMCAIPNNYMELLKSINQGEPVSPRRKSGFNDALAVWALDIVGSKQSSKLVERKIGSKFSFASWWH